MDILLSAGTKTVPNTPSILGNLLLVIGDNQVQKAEMVKVESEVTMEKLRGMLHLKDGSTLTTVESITDLVLEIKAMKFGTARQR